MAPTRSAGRGAMTGIVTVVCLVLAGLTALGAGLDALHQRGIGRRELLGAGLTEIAVLVYAGVRVADLAGGHRADSTAIVVAYLVGLILTLPIAAALAWAEPTRWGSITLAS